MKDIVKHMKDRKVFNSKYFFLNPSGKPLSRQSINKIVTKIVKGAKVHIDEKEGWKNLITPHSFRRVFATSMYL